MSSPIDQEEEMDCLLEIEKMKREAHGQDNNSEEENEGLKLQDIEGSDPYQDDPYAEEGEEEKTKQSPEVAANNLGYSTEKEKEFTSRSSRLNESQAVQTKLEPTELEPSEIEPTELEPTELEPSELEPTEVEPTEIDPTGPGSMLRKEHKDDDVDGKNEKFAGLEDNSLENVPETKPLPSGQMDMDIETDNYASKRKRDREAKLRALIKGMEENGNLSNDSDKESSSPSPKPAEANLSRTDPKKSKISRKRKLVVEESDDSEGDEFQDPLISPETSADPTTKHKGLDSDDESDRNSNRPSRTLEKLQDDSQKLEAELDEIKKDLDQLKETKSQPTDQEPQGTFRRKKWNKDEQISKIQAALRKNSSHKRQKPARNHAKITAALGNIFKRINERAKDIAPSRVMVNYARQHGEMPEIPTVEFTSPYETFKDPKGVTGRPPGRESEDEAIFEEPELEAKSKHPIKPGLKLTFDKRTTGVVSSDSSSSDGSDEEFYIAPPSKVDKENKDPTGTSRKGLIQAAQVFTVRQQRASIMNQLKEKRKLKSKPMYEAYEPATTLPPPVKIVHKPEGEDESAPEGNEGGMISDEEELLQELVEDVEGLEEDKDAEQADHEDIESSGDEGEQVADKDDQNDNNADEQETLPSTEPVDSAKIEDKETVTFHPFFKHAKPSVEELKFGAQSTPTDENPTSQSEGTPDLLFEHTEVFDSGLPVSQINEVERQESAETQPLEDDSEPRESTETQPLELEDEDDPAKISQSLLQNEESEDNELKSQGDEPKSQDSLADSDPQPRSEEKLRELNLIEDEAEESDDCEGKDDSEPGDYDDNGDGFLADLVASDAQVEQEIDDAERVLESERIMEEEFADEEADIKAIAQRYLNNDKKVFKGVSRRVGSGELEEDEETKEKFARIEEDTGRKLCKWEKKLIQAEEISTQPNDGFTFMSDSDGEEETLKYKLERKVSLLESQDSDFSRPILSRIESDSSSRQIFQMTKKTNLSKQGKKMAGKSQSSLSFAAFNKAVELQRPKLKRQGSFRGKQLTARQAHFISKKASSSSVSVFAGGSSSKNCRGAKLTRHSSRSFVFARDFEKSLPGDSKGQPSSKPLKRSRSNPSTSTSSNDDGATFGGALFAALSKSRFRKPSSLSKKRSSQKAY
ncbi:hypothetical protein AAMO2058_000706700 [Amorphochlora amoebiformis]